MPELIASIVASLSTAATSVFAAVQDQVPAVADAAAEVVTTGGPLADMAETALAGKLSSYLFVSGVLFLLGLATILTRRNALYVLMGVELILNAANLNFVAFARFGDYGLDGQLVAITVIVIAAAEAAIALAIVLRVFHDFGSVDITRTDSLRD